MTYEINIFKGFDGWRAESIASLGQTSEGERKLTLTTSKIRGGLAVSARVSVHKNDTKGYSVMTTAIFGDFYKGGIDPTPCKRITEKSVLDVHRYALRHMDNLIIDAKKFYAEREATNA